MQRAGGGVNAAVQGPRGFEEGFQYIDPLEICQLCGGELDRSLGNLTLPLCLQLDHEMTTSRLNY